MVDYAGNEIGVEPTENYHHKIRIYTTETIMKQYQHTIYKSTMAVTIGERQKGILSKLTGP